jgi:N-acetylglucosamine-6-phosphate deacetylase
VVGAALENQTAWCGLIVDGRHVDPAVLRIALRTRPLDRFMLVTDAMPTVGMIDKSFDLQGRQIHVVDGVCVDAHGTLAGSDLDMISAVRNAMSMLGLSLEGAVAMASASPAAFLGLTHQRGRIAVGQAADLVLLDDALQVQDTWINGAISA